MVNKGLSLKKRVQSNVWELCLDIKIMKFPCNEQQNMSDSQPMPSARPGEEELGWGHRERGQQLWSSASLQHVLAPGVHCHHTAWGRRRCWKNKPSILLPRWNFAPWQGRGRSSSPLVVATERENVHLKKKGISTWNAFYTKAWLKK